MNNSNLNINEHALSFKDEAQMKVEKHGLRGHVEIFRENMETGEKTLWYEDDNIIPISGYQWVLMKMFGLHLDSEHGTLEHDDIGQDTTIVIPDLNESAQLNIGINPNEYGEMTSDISENHFIQGFIVGNQGSGEDAITTKNTDYSFINLRNAIPFQETQVQGDGNVTGLDPSIAGKYLGVYRQATDSRTKSYYIKKFDSRPHIYHNWWRDGQKWDYLDPVQPADLGPNAKNGSGKTNRIETYAQVEMSIDVDNGDCMAWFNHATNDQTAMINELGLVAFDTVPGTRSTLEKLYQTSIKKLIRLIFDDNRGDVDSQVVSLATDISTVLETIRYKDQPNINSFLDTIVSLTSITEGEIDYKSIQAELLEDSNIEVEAFYNHEGVFVYSTDKFMDYISSNEFRDLSTDEAQRIKLITYYTFNSIPLQANWKILINYRIYAN